MSKFYYTDPTTQARSADRSGLRQVRGLGLVVDLSAQSRHVRTLSVGLVWSGRRQGTWVRVVEFRNDTTRPDQRQILVGPVPNSTIRTRT